MAAFNSDFPMQFCFSGFLFKTTKLLGFGLEYLLVFISVFISIFVNYTDIT